MAKGRQEREPGAEAFSTSPMRTPKLPVVRSKKKTESTGDAVKPSADTKLQEPGTNTEHEGSLQGSQEQQASQISQRSESSAAPQSRVAHHQADSVETQTSDSRTAKSTSTFGRWRREREKERQTEIAREQELREEQGRIDQLRNDPGLDGLLAEDRHDEKSVKRRPLTRMRKILYGTGAFLLAALLYIGLVFYSPLLAVQTIRVEGASLLDSVQIEQKLEPLRGTPLTRIDDRKVRELIDQEHVLRDVKIEAHPPHELVVTLKERTPVAVVRQDGKFVVVDSEGVGLREVESIDGVNVPLVDLGGGNSRDSAEFRTVANVLAALPSSVLSQVKEARASSTSNINLTLKDGVVVQWGTAEESDLKAKVLTKLMDAVREEQTKAANQGQATNKVGTYDVSSPRVPVTR